MSLHLGVGPTEYTGHRPGDHEYNPAKGRARSQASRVFPFGAEPQPGRAAANVIVEVDPYAAGAGPGSGAKQQQQQQRKSGAPPPDNARAVRARQDAHAAPIAPDPAGPIAVWDSLEREEAQRRHNAEVFEALREGRKPPAAGGAAAADSAEGYRHPLGDIRAYAVGDPGNRDAAGAVAPDAVANRHREDAESGARVFGFASPPRPPRQAFGQAGAAGGGSNREAAAAAEAELQDRSDRLFGAPRPAPVAGRRAMTPPARTNPAQQQQQQQAAPGVQPEHSSVAVSLEERLRDEKLRELERHHDRQREELERRRNELERRQGDIDRREREESERRLEEQRKRLEERERELERKRLEERERELERKQQQQQQQQAYLPSALDADGVTPRRSVPIPAFQAPYFQVAAGQGGVPQAVLVDASPRQFAAPPLRIEDAAGGGMIVPVSSTAAGGGGGGGGGTGGSGDANVVSVARAEARVAETESRLARLEEELRGQVSGLADQRAELALQLKQVARFQRDESERVSALNGRLDRSEQFVLRFHDDLRRKVKQDDNDISRIELDLKDSREAAEQLKQEERDRALRNTDEIRRLKQLLETEREESQRLREQLQGRFAQLDAAVRESLSQAQRNKDDVATVQGAIARVAGSVESQARAAEERLDAARAEADSRVRDARDELKRLVARVVAEFTHSSEEAARVAEARTSAVAEDAARQLASEREERQRRELEVAAKIDRELRARDQREAEVTKMLLEKNSALETTLEVVRTERDAELARLRASFDQLAQATDRQVRGEAQARRAAFDAVREHYDGELAQMRGRVGVVESTMEHRYSGLAEVLRAEIKSRLFTSEDLRQRFEHFVTLNQSDHQALKADILAIEDRARGQAARLEQREAAARSELLVRAREEAANHRDEVTRQIADVELVASSAARRLDAMDAQREDLGDRMEETERHLRAHLATSEVRAALDSIVDGVVRVSEEDKASSVAAQAEANRVSIARLQDGALAELEEAHAELADALEEAVARISREGIDQVDAVRETLEGRIEDAETLAEEALDAARSGAADVATFAACSDALSSIVARVAEGAEEDAWAAGALAAASAGVVAGAPVADAARPRPRGASGAGLGTGARSGADRVRETCEAIVAREVAPLRERVDEVAGDAAAALEREIADVYRTRAVLEDDLNERLEASVVSLEGQVRAEKREGSSAAAELATRVDALEADLNGDVRPQLEDVAAETERAVNDAATAAEEQRTAVDSLRGALRAEIAERERLTEAVARIDDDVLPQLEDRIEDATDLARETRAELNGNGEPAVPRGGAKGKRGSSAAAAAAADGAVGGGGTGAGLLDRVAALEAATERELAAAHVEREAVRTSLLEDIEVLRAEVAALVQDAADSALEAAESASAGIARDEANAVRTEVVSLSKRIDAMRADVEALVEREVAAVHVASDAAADRVAGQVREQIDAVGDDARAAREVAERASEAADEARDAAQDEVDRAVDKVRRRVDEVEERADDAASAARRAERAAETGLDDLKESVRDLKEEVEGLKSKARRRSSDSKSPRRKAGDEGNDNKGGRAR